MPDEIKYAVIVEAGGYDKELIDVQIELSTLIEAYIDPYERDDSFIVDGYSVNRETIIRLKIVQCEGSYFCSQLSSMSHTMRHNEDARIRDAAAKNYDTAFQALVRSDTRDVTNQLIRAYNSSDFKTFSGSLAERAEKAVEIAATLSPIIQKLVGS